jgi:uncharacterized protein YkvS
MAMRIENKELDETNEEFNYAAEIVKHTNKLVYLTGKAGTGKTFFLKYLQATTFKNTVILAPTGVAAVNAGGQTIHSFFNLSFGPYVLNDKRLRVTRDHNDPDDTTIYNTFRYQEGKRNLIENLELLIIDEISMVRCDTLDVIDKILRVFRNKVNSPFGGVQVVLIGDTFQLPPIADFEQWEILKGYYESPFFFSSRVVNENKPIYIELKKIYRQSEIEFIDLLNKIRVNEITSQELNKLNEKYNPVFSSKELENHIILTTTNVQVSQTNATKLEELNTDLKLFEGRVEGLFPKDVRGDFILPTEMSLYLKEGAQVMTLKNNNNGLEEYFNGKIGKIASLDNNIICVEFTSKENSKIVQIEKATWHNIKYTWNAENGKIENEIIGTFTQYPLRLAWAITVHKSQGLEFESVIADLGSAFEDGQVYVALSRCTSFKGLVLKSLIPRSKIRTNPKVLEFAKTETPSTLIHQELSFGKADAYYKNAREAIKITNFVSAYDNILKAIRFRNDLETDVFKKAICTYGKKFEWYKYRYFEAINALKQLKGQHLEATEYLKSANEIIKKQKRQLIDQKEAFEAERAKNEMAEKKIIELGNNLSVCSTRLETSQTQLANFKNLHINALSDVEKKDYLIALQEDTIRKLRREAESDQLAIKNRKNDIEKLANEIILLKKMKWYELLFKRNR